MTLIKGKVLTNAERCKRRFIKHPERHRKSINEYRRKQRLAAIAILGGVCKKCGFSDVRALQIDHINGGGVKELKKVNGTEHTKKVIRSVLNKENKYQLLCANCNWIKRVLNKEATGRPLIKNNIII